MIRTLQQEWKTNGLRALLKPAVLLAVPGLAYALGRQATPRLAQLVVLVVGGSLSFIVLTRRLQWGLLALIPVSFLVPWEMSTGTQVSVNATIVLVLFVVAVWILRMGVIEGELRLAPSRVNAPAIAFVAATTVSLVAGNIRWISFREPASLAAQLGGWTLYVAPMAVLLLTGNQLRQLRWLRALTWIYLAFGGLYIVSRLTTWLSSVSRSLFSSGSTGAMFWTWLVALALGQALWNRDLRPRWRLLLAMLAATTLWVGLFHGREWLSGWLPPLIAVVIIFWLRSWRWGLALTVIIGLLLLLYYPMLTPQVMTPQQQYSAESRAAAWPIMMRLIKANPILGLGPSNYYHYTPLYALWGWYVRFNSHNNYLDIVAQTGLVGMGAFVWLVVELGVLGRRLRRQTEDGFIRGYADGALGGLAGMLAAGWMADWILPFTYNIGFAGFRTSVFAWLFLGGLVALQPIVAGDTTQQKRRNRTGAGGR